MTAKKSIIKFWGTPGTAHKRLKKLTSFNNTTLNKHIFKALAFWMFMVLSPFDFQKIDCGKAPETLNQCLYGCIRYCWAGVKQFSINDIVYNYKFTKLLTSWMFKEFFSFFVACIIGFDMNWLTDLKQAWIYLHLSKQSMFVSLKLA